MEVTRAGRRTLVQALRELWGAQDILWNMVRRDFSTQHRDSFLGVAWSLINPLFMAGLYTLVFKFLRQPPDPGVTYPFVVSFFAGLIMWNLFANAASTGVSAITGGAYLVNKVYFPREIMPLALVFVGATTFIFEFIVLLALMLAFQVWPTPYVLLAPVFVFIVMLFAAGCGLLFSALNVRFRDMQHFVALLMIGWFWLTPVLISLNGYARAGGEPVEMLIKANPLTGALVGFKNVMLDGRMPSLQLSLYSLGWALFALLAGYWYFNREEPRFSEMI